MSDISQFSNLNLPIDTVVTLGFYVVAGMYVIFTAIFYYHWKTYSTDTKVTNLTFILYFVTTLPLMLIMGILLLNLL